MKISVFLTETGMQFNLTPENEHEKYFLGIMKKFTGEATIKSGVSIQENQAGYYREFAQSDTVAVVIKKKSEE